MSVYDLLHGDDSVYLKHYGTKGMRWGVRKKARTFVRTVKKQHAKDVANARDKDVKFLRKLGMHKSADAVAANKSAGHALSKNLKSVTKSRNGRRAIAAGISVVGATLAVALNKTLGVPTSTITTIVDSQRY